MNILYFRLHHYRLLNSKLIILIFMNILFNKITVIYYQIIKKIKCENKSTTPQLIF